MLATVSFLLEKLRIDSYLRPESYLGELGVDENLMSEEFWHTLREAAWETTNVRNFENVGVQNTR